MPRLNPDDTITLTKLEFAIGNAIYDASHATIPHYMDEATTENSTLPLSREQYGVVAVACQYAAADAITYLLQLLLSGQFTQAQAEELAGLDPSQWQKVLLGIASYRAQQAQAQAAQSKQS